jgi:putative FmdB family regulatory protein
MGQAICRAWLDDVCPKIGSGEKRMPIFEFICQDCHKEFEELVMGSTKVQCPHCDGVKVEKMMSTFRSGGAGQGAGHSSCSSCKPSAGGCSGCGH